MEWRSAGALFGRRCTNINTMMTTLHRLLAALSFAMLSGLAGAAEPLLVRHNFFVGPDSNQLNYKGEVLVLLLEKSKSRFGPYVLERGAQVAWSQNRAYAELERGKLDLISSMTNESREKTSIPIRYCLYMGLLGMRIGVGAPKRVHELDKLKTWDELKQVQLGQVFDWPDYAIQTEAGLKVLRPTEAASSYQRLKLGTFDLLPLGIVEAEPIAKRNALATISTWAIAYPTAYYFFVSKTRPELAERLAYGFEQAIKDHSFEQLFSKRIGPLVTAAKLDKRKIFYLKNPFLPKETPLGRKELWHPLIHPMLQEH
jgi:hypothetical protein